MGSSIERIRLAVTVMAYPAISAKYGESVCVAGIRTDLPHPSWVRLYPFKVRDHPPESERIHKWDEIAVAVERPSTDRRPESFMPHLASVSRLRHLKAGDWVERYDILEGLQVFASMREVERQQERTRSSLAAVDTGEILDLAVKEVPRAELEEQRRRAHEEASQLSLLDATNGKVPLEPIPYSFHFIVRYDDEVEPRRLKIVDWEINAAWRNWRREYPDPEERIKQKWLDEVCGPDRDPRFFVGNMHRFPAQFLLLSVFWPPRH